MEELDINGKPAINSQQPLSPQEAGEWALKLRAKADPRKAAIERLRCAAAKRREKNSINPINTAINPTHRVATFNPEADAFNVESSDGKKLLGNSLSNGNVKTGQTVKTFYVPQTGKVVIDVKPKGRDITIPKPEVKLVTEKEYWPVTSCFLYSRIKPNKEKLTGNGAAQGIEETSWDAMRLWSSPAPGSYAYGFAERLDTMGDYQSASDALNNILKPDRLIAPGGSGAGSGFARDNAVATSRSKDAITIWFYVGNPADALTNGRIVEVTGPSFHPSNGGITTSGPGYCLEVYRGSFAGSVIFPSEAMGAGPLTKHLKQSFPELGGKIGYAGRIERWNGTQDYTTTVLTTYFRSTPSPAQPNQVPTSLPSWYTPNPSVNPWNNYTNNAWFEFGWPSPQYIGCASTSWINIELTALNATTACGAPIAPDKWYWGGDVSPSRGVITKDNPSGFIGTTGIFVCWRGHLEHAGMAASYFEAFRVYWGIAGTVTKLGSANFYGCEIPGSGGGYPSPPPSEASRFLVEAYGRKAKVFLVCHKQDYEPIEIELPFEYAAVVEEMTVLGGGSFDLGSAFESRKTNKALRTYSATYSASLDPFSLELIHGTLSIDAEFAYINLFYGGERIHEEPMNFPVPIRLAAQGFGSPMTGPGSNYGDDINFLRRLGLAPDSYRGYLSAGHPQTPEQTGETYARFLKDCWTRCLAIKVRLPTKDNKALSIVATQKYKRGENITLTANNPDNEFDNKFLIRDYRTDNTLLSLVSPNRDFASFGGLPALGQQMFINSTTYTNSDIPAGGLFYKEKQDFTAMDWVHYQLQEMPRQYNPLVTVLPAGVTISTGGAGNVNVINDLDKKFGRHGRAEKIMRAASFGYSGTYYGGDSPAYRTGGSIQAEPLFISHKEQIIGNGLKVNGVLTKWFRVTTSSFPVLGQLLRNNS